MDDEQPGPGAVPLRRRRDSVWETLKETNGQWKQQTRASHAGDREEVVRVLASAEVQGGVGPGHCAVIEGLNDGVTGRSQRL